MLISNNGMRQLNQMMFNDSIMSFYVLLCIFFVSKNRPISGAFSLTLGLSIKTGAILLFPGFLGWVQYQHGTIKLLVSIIILISFQLIIALPFYNNDAALALGFKQGADGNLVDYVKNSKMLGGNADNAYGATFDLTIYWRFFGRNIYHSPYFLLFLKAAIAGVNVWFFFIRRNYFIECLY